MGTIKENELQNDSKFEVMLKNTKDNFVALTYYESLEILKTLANLQEQNKVMILFVGANGSGKSTLVANLVKNTNFKFRYLNADIFQVQNDLDAYASMITTMNIVKNTILCGESFAYETVFSHESKLDLVKLAKENGYKIITVYLTTKNVNINLSRVEKRVIQGGHDVDKDKIIERYKRTAKNVEKLELLSDEFYEFDNSKDV